MRVLGALYGVTLVVAPDEHDATTSATKTSTKPGRKSANKPAGTKKTVNRAPAAAKKARPLVPPTKTTAERPTQKTARRSVDPPSNAEVRSWARQNGFTVSDRGRLPASVVTAYRNTQNA